MNHIKTLIKENKGKLLRITLYAGMLLLAYMSFMNFYITSDYIPSASHGGTVPMPSLKTALSGGRFLYYPLGWLYYLLSKVGISYYYNAYVMQLMGIAVYAVMANALYQLFENFCKTSKQKGLLFGVVLLCFINPFMVETFVYGCFEWSVGMALAVFAVGKLAQKKYISGFLLALCATSVYQTNILIAAVILLAYLFMECFGQKLTLIIGRFFSSMGILVGAAVLNVLLQKLVVLSGNNSSPSKEAHIAQDYGDYLLTLFGDIKSILIWVQGMYPKWSLILIWLIAAVICCYTVILKRKQYLYGGFWFVLSLGMLFVPFAYKLITPHIGYTPRVLLALFYAVAMILIGGILLAGESRILTNFLIIFLSVGALVNWYYTNTCITDCFIRQALDYDEVICIQSEIEEYELETGYTICRVIAGKDSNPTYVSRELHLDYWDTYSRRIIFDEWAQTAFLNYVNHTQYECGWMTEEEYEAFFSNGEWDTFNPSEQLVFEGDTMYWAIY